MLPAHLRVLLLQRLLVLNGLRLHVIDLGLAALARIAVEHACLGTAEPNVGQFLGEIDRVVDAAVHAHAADRVVDVGAVAGEQHAAFVEGRGDALVHGIERVIGNFVFAALLMDALQAALDAGHAQRRLVGLLFRHREYAAPDAGRAFAFDLEQVDPLVRVGEIIPRAVALAGGAEIKAGADLDEALGVSEARERDLGEAPHRAGAAVAADQIFAAELFGFAGGVGDRGLDVVGGLRQPGELG